nr:stress-response a/b barrel domain-containing protein up3 [Quercus suber]
MAQRLLLFQLLRDYCWKQATFKAFKWSIFDETEDLDSLASYLAHPSHVSVVKENVLPIIDDIMAVEWVSSSDEGHVYSVPSGSAVKLSLLKLKENLGEDVKSEIFRAIKGIKDSFPKIS